MAAMAKTKASFPVQQMAILAVCRFAEPVAATSVNPYIPEMIASFDVATDQIGVYSGWLSAVFALCQATTGIAWGRASDKFGRKPMILLALISIMVSSVMFGFSKSLSMAFISRSIQGASSGNVGIIRTAVAEMVPQKELQPRAFSVMPLVWNIGSIFGPIIGGFLTNPQRRGWFLNSTLLKHFPYTLPNLMISSLFIVGIVVGFLFLKETHQEKKHQTDYGLKLGSTLISSCSKRKKPWWRQNQDEAEAFLGNGASEAPFPVNRDSITTKTATLKPTWKEIFSRQSTINLVAYTGLAMHSAAFDQLMPVFMHHPVDTTLRSSSGLKFSGGFGLDSSQIGVLFTIYGIFGMLIQFAVFPPLARKFGVLNCFKGCAIVFPCAYLLVPFTSLLSTSTLRQTVCLGLMLFKCAAGIFAFPCSTILLTNSAVSLTILGTLNGVATSISASGRAAGPALTGWAFTIGVDVDHIIIPFWFLMILAVLSAVPIWSLVEMEGPSKATADADENAILDDESDDATHDLHNPNFRTASNRKLGPGILSGTEEDVADLLLDDDIPLTSQSSTVKNSSSRRRKSSSYSLRALESPVIASVKTSR